MKIFAETCIALAVLAIASPVTAETWRTGPEFRKHLDEGMGVSWTSNPLRPALMRLAEQQRLAIFLDRRVDPGQRIDFSVQGVSVDESLRRLAHTRGLGICYVGSVVYFGPTATTSALATISAKRRDELSRRVRDGSSGGNLAQTLTWQDLATPRALIQTTVQAAGLTLSNADAIPHDLWAAGELPPQHLAERLMILLAGFELSFRVAENGAIQIVPWTAPEPLTRNYTVKGDAASAAEQIGRLFPAAQVKSQAGGLAVTAYAEDHEAISRLLRGETARRRTVVAGETRYSLKMENSPVGPLLKGLGQRLNLQVEFDSAISDKLETPVSFDLKDATLEQLLDAVARPAKLGWKREGDKLLIVPGEAKDR